MGLALCWDILNLYMVYLHQDVFLYTLILVNDGFYELCCWVERKGVGSRIYPCITLVFIPKLSEMLPSELEPLFYILYFTAVIFPHQFPQCTSSNGVEQVAIIN